MGFFNFFKKPRKETKPYVPFELVETAKGDYNELYNKLKKYSLIMLIIGKRGSGKTALGMKFLEIFLRKKRKVYAIGFEKSKLPFKIKKTESIDNIKNGSVVLIDEGAVLYSARESMKDRNKQISKIMSVARHKDLTLILITQSSAMIDVNVLRLSDILLMKEPSLLQSKFERKALKEFYDKVHLIFQSKENKKELFYVFDDDFEGLLKFSLPEFWNESISKSFR